MQRLLGMFVLFLLPMFASGVQAAEKMVNLAARLSQHLFDERSGEAGSVGYTYACPVFGRCNHRVVGLFIERRQHRRQAWVVAAYPNEDSCHACTSKMTLEWYERSGERWRKVRAFRNFVEWGDWGQVAPDEVEMVRLDGGRLLLFLKLSYMGQGYVTDSMEVFLVSRRGIRSLGAFMLGEDDSGAVVDRPARWWKANYRVEERGRNVHLLFRVSDSGGKVNEAHFRLTARGWKPVGRADPRLVPPR